MPDTKRACTHFLNYVNAFNNGPLRDQQAIRETRHPGFIEVSLKMLLAGFRSRINRAGDSRRL